MMTGFPAPSAAAVANCSSKGAGGGVGGLINASTPIGTPAAVYCWAKTPEASPTPLPLQVTVNTPRRPMLTDGKLWLAGIVVFTRNSPKRCGIPTSVMVQVASTPPMSAAGSGTLRTVS